MKKKGFTLIELLVVISIIAMLLAILMPALSKVKKIAQRVVCSTNLKGLGTAQVVYSQDFDDEFAVQDIGRADGSFNWEWTTSGFQSKNKDWKNGGDVTVASSLYLLVRLADVSPKNYVCPSGEESEYDGTNTKDLDIVQLWDFGGGSNDTGGYPYEHVSYSYQMPYNADMDGRSRGAADGTASAAFAVMADKNPWLDPQIENLGEGGADGQTWTDYVGRMQNYYTDDAQYSESSWEVKIANAYSHGRDGQNVVYADGHAGFEKTPDVGYENDNIYVPRGTGGNALNNIRRGYAADLKGGPDHDAEVFQPVGNHDSFLINDDTHDGM